MYWFGYRIDPLFHFGRAAASAGRACKVQVDFRQPALPRSTHRASRYAKVQDVVKDGTLKSYQVVPRLHLFLHRLSKAW